MKLALPFRKTGAGPTIRGLKLRWLSFSRKQQILIPVITLVILVGVSMVIWWVAARSSSGSNAETAKVIENPSEFLTQQKQAIESSSSTSDEDKLLQLMHLAYYYGKTGQLNKMLETLEGAKQDHPTATEMPLYWSNLFTAHAGLNQAEEARTTARKILELEQQGKDFSPYLTDEQKERVTQYAK